MLSVITRPEGSVADLAALLSDLVPGAVEGLIRDVLVLEPEAGEADPALDALCEAAGVNRVGGGLAIAVRQARSDLLLLASPRLRLDSRAIEGLGRELARRGPGGVARGLALSGPAFLGVWPLARPLGVIAPRAHFLGLPAGAGLDQALTRARRGVPRFRPEG